MENTLQRLIQGSEIKTFIANPRSKSHALRTRCDDYVEQIIATESIEQIGWICSAICNNYGFDFFAVFVRIQSRRGLPLCIFMREYEDAWTNHYEKHQYMFSDPNIRLATTTASPFIWSSHLFKNVIHLLSKAELQVSCDAMDFGLRNVVNAPFHGENGNYGLVRFINKASGQSTQADESFQPRKTPELYYLSSFIYESVARLLSDKVARTGLTLREKEVLSWAAHGMSPVQIGLSLNISENTVRKHLSNIRHRLNVRNTTHAVAKAIASRMIVY